MRRETTHILAIVCLLLCCMQAKATDVTYRGFGPLRDAYHTELLQAVLDQGKPNEYTAKSYDGFIPHRRGFELLSHSDELDVMIGYATQDRVEKYHAINIPIMKGLNGWRVVLVHEDNAKMMAGVDSLDKLKPFMPGMFHTWTDNEIFLENGIDSIRGTDFKGVYRMLGAKRFDYLPLSILEAASEAELYKEKYNIPITVDQNIMITYPTCFYFYVAKENTELAQTLTAGFDKIIKNGVFDKIFNKHFSGLLKEYLSGDRSVIELSNPLLPKSVPLHKPELWLQYQNNGRETTLYH